MKMNKRIINKLINMLNDIVDNCDNMETPETNYYDLLEEFMDICDYGEANLLANAYDHGNTINILEDFIEELRV